MTKAQLKRIFAKIKEEAKLDFAETEPRGDCNTCNWGEIRDDLGDDARGIWLKHWSWGGNKSKFDTQTNYIAHDLTEEQKYIVADILSRQFIVDWDKSDNKAIIIKQRKRRPNL